MDKELIRIKINQQELDLSDLSRKRLNMFLHSTEMNIQFVKVLQKCAKRCSLSHLGEGVDILWKALATITELAVGTRDISVGVVDVT